MPNSSLRLALFQPDIPQNTGTMIRLAACFGVGVDIIEPCGFVWSDSKLRRSGLDYLELASVTRHTDWTAFTAAKPAPSRLVLLTTKGAIAHHTFAFQPTDILMVGQESAGVPEYVHEAADARVVIPMQAGVRSINVALSAAIVLAEALRQTGGF